MQESQARLSLLPSNILLTLLCKLYDAFMGNKYRDSALFIFKYHIELIICTFSKMILVQCKDGSKIIYFHKPDLPLSRWVTRGQVYICHVKLVNDTSSCSHIIKLISRDIFMKNGSSSWQLSWRLLSVVLVNTYHLLIIQDNSFHQIHV